MSYLQMFTEVEHFTKERWHCQFWNHINQHTIYYCWTAGNPTLFIFSPWYAI